MSDVDDFDMDDAFRKADMFFEEEQEESALKEYLKKVLNTDSVTLGNFTPKQTKGLYKVMCLDKMYLKPSDEVDDKDNVLKQAVKVAVETSKGKNAFAIDKMGEFMLGRLKMGESGESILKHIQDGSDGDGDNGSD